jgi:hypothetical protein
MVMADLSLGKLTSPGVFGKTRHAVVSGTLVIVPVDGCQQSGSWLE